MIEIVASPMPPQVPRYRGDESNDLKELDPKQRGILDTQLIDYLALNEVDLTSELRDRFMSGDSTLPVGTFIHGIGFSADAVEGVARYGIVSGELVGKGEDGETHYCADFFRIENTTTIVQYCEDIAGIEPGNRFLPRIEREYLPSIKKFSQNLIGIVVDTAIPELEPLLEADAYAKDTEELFEGIISALPVDKDSPQARRLAAILVGLPRGAIAGIILGTRVAADAEKVRKINQEFQGKVPLMSVAGDVLSVG